MKRSDYNHKNLKGNDVSIEISLQEYGFAWVETKTEYLFYYGIKNSGESYTRFDFCSFDKTMDVAKEFDWADFDAVSAYVGSDVLLDNDILGQIGDLLSYYGYEEIFGTSYWEGLIYPQVISGGGVRLQDIDETGEHYTAEQIAGFTQDSEGIQNIKLINKFYRVQDESDKYPIRNDFNATERAIRRVRKYDCPVYGIEYCYAIEDALSDIVNNY